jgi:hypothetical protein
MTMTGVLTAIGFAWLLIVLLSFGLAQAAAFGDRMLTHAVRRRAPVAVERERLMRRAA